MVRATVKMKITKLSDTNICHQTTLIKKYDITFDRPPNVITDIWETYLLINGYLTRANIIWSRLHSAPPIMVAIQLYIYMGKKKILHHTCEKNFRWLSFGKKTITQNT